MMFPEGFWFDSVMVIGGLSGAQAVFTGVMSWVALRRITREKGPTAQA